MTSGVPQYATYCRNMARTALSDVEREAWARLADEADAYLATKDTDEPVPATPTPDDEPLF